MTAPQERPYQQAMRFRNVDLQEARSLVDGLKHKPDVKVVCRQHRVNDTTIERTKIPHLDHKNGMADGLKNLERNMIKADEVIVFVKVSAGTSTAV